MRLLNPQKARLISMQPDKDKGPLIPHNLDPSETCFSPGLDEIHGVEDDCLKAAINPFSVDYSVDNPPANRKNTDHIKKYIPQSFGIIIKRMFKIGAFIK